MLNLLRADFVRLFKSKFFYVVIVMTALSTLFVMQSDGAYWGSDGPRVCDFDTVSWLPFVPFSAVTVVCLFCDGDYRAGAIRNKVIVGQIKIRIYLSNFIVCAVGAAICFLAGCTMIAVIASLKHQTWISSFSETLYLFLAVAVIILSSVSLALFFAMLIPLPAVGSVIILAILIFAMFTSAVLGDILQRPKYRIVYDREHEWLIETINEIEDYDEKVQVALEYGCAEPNPYYVGGIKRLAVGAAAYLIPGGQAAMLYKSVDDAILYQKNVNPAFPLAVSAAFAAVLAALGTLLFSRKDIK